MDEEEAKGFMLKMGGSKRGEQFSLMYEDFQKKLNSEVQTSAVGQRLFAWLSRSKEVESKATAAAAEAKASPEPHTVKSA